ncbi:vesicular glutamate transporter [Plakobranchus ocellatus]|uniref:Vesicular glutamate transporter n=1 Tax=Plakobranchus ocellatus TaxID=259542 RepID=A0AAV4BRP3_9GAST|nr:vesicular glutamate transporter [Plakobranchus ocellatus]
MLHIDSNMTESVGVVEVENEDYTESSFYHRCTAYNTSRDYVSDFGWTMSVMFYSVYYLGMGIGYVAAGSVLSKIAAHHVLLGGWYASALLHLLLPFVFKRSGYAVMLMRLITGFSESILQPAFVALTKSWAFKGEESTFLSVGLIGVYLSPVLSSVIVGACLCYISWHASLYILGGVLFLWTVLWHFVSYDSPLDCPRLSDGDISRYRREQTLDIQSKGNKAKGRNVPWKQILTSKPVWAIWVASISKNVSLAAVAALAPLYFKDVYGFRAADSGLLLVAPFTANTLSALVSSYISDRVTRSGKVSMTAARKITQCAGSAGDAFFLILTIYLPDWRVSVLCLTLAKAMAGLCFLSCACNAMDLSPHFSGAVTGVSSTGMFMVFLIMGVTSLIPENSEASGGINRWTAVFWINAGIAIFSSIFYLLFASGEVQPWGLGAEEDIGACTPLKSTLVKEGGYDMGVDKSEHKRTKRENGGR